MNLYSKKLYRFMTKNFQVPFYLPSFYICIKKIHYVTLLLRRYSWIETLKIWLAKSFLNHAPQKICELSLTFLGSTAACQKSGRFTNSYLRYGWFKNSEVRFAENHFEFIKLRIFKSPFILLRSISTWQKFRWFTHLLLRYS